ncbi:haloacid dehalogenase-like hydrolase [Neiella marina]|uniref:Haloacid dehalogenase-like hydrolase n=1 Tax=Neiella holothuriorum TaxID=2870530 RepID=A0ABS7ECP1_9GAMM|nr:HAD family hydrolase [Neiella holothuriorum]MBW8190098.1 haloacid dehalogenase-like hydrolase [Neiella holothuriorum]
MSLMNDLVIDKQRASRLPMAAAWCIKLSLMFVLMASGALQASELSLWQGDAKARITGFINAVSDPKSPSYVAPAERVAVIDNNGTMWAEQPASPQLLFAMAQAQNMVNENPELLNQPVFKAANNNDLETLRSQGITGLLQLFIATHVGLPIAEFEARVSRWIATAKNPKTNQLHTDMTYLPMLELLALLRKHDFDIWLATSGSAGFVRAWSEQVYAIPPDRVIASELRTEYRVLNGRPSLIHMPEVGFINSKGNKVVAINERIGRRPILAIGNSDHDIAMLEWTTSGEGKRLGILIHHTDSKREFAYDKDAYAATLDEGLATAKQQDWLVVDMKQDWTQVFKWQ